MSVVVATVQENACVVPITMQTCAVVVIDRDAREGEIHLESGWFAMFQPSRE